jgi:hypothetical protein
MTTINFTRRQFIGSTVLVALAATVYYYRVGSIRAAHPAYLVGEILNSGKSTGRIAAISEYGEIIRRWTIPFPVHAVAHNIGQPWQAAAFETGGNALAIADLRTQRRVQVINCPEEMLFSGKGVFSVDGTKLFATAYHSETEAGFILVYDTETLELKNKMDSTGIHPVGIQYDVKKSEHLIIAHAGNKESGSNLTWLDEASGKAAQTIFTEVATATLSRFIQTDNGEIYAYGDKGDVGYFNRDLRKIKITQEFIPRKSSVTNSYFDSFREKLWISLTDDDSILVLEAKTLKLVKDFKATKPRSMIAVTPQRPYTLMVSVEGKITNEGMQRSYDLAEIKGTDEALERPQKFYGTSATALVVALQDQ